MFRLYTHFVLFVLSLSKVAVAISTPAPPSNDIFEEGSKNSLAAAAAAECTVTRFAGVEAAKSSCTNIVLDSIVVPAATILDLTKLKKGTTVTFKGVTKFEYGTKDIDLIEIGGTDITIQGAEGAVLDGNGNSWWDGKGSNDGVEKPNHFITVKRVLGNSFIKNLYILNFPVHCFYISGSEGLILENITLNNTAGDEPNANSDGEPAAHNTDGFGIAASNNIILRDSKVWNQDDCVAITSGNNITVSNMYCSGGHGLSIGSVGGKEGGLAKNTVTNVTFRDSVVAGQENALRIKSNADETGLIKGIKYENIRIENATKYGLIIQQDYLNGGPTGEPTNGVKIQDITVKNVTGTAGPKARNYYILCGSGSCSDFKLNDISITGGMKGDYCNSKWTGNFACPTTKPSNL